MAMMAFVFTLILAMSGLTVGNHAGQDLSEKVKDFVNSDLGVSRMQVRCYEEILMITFCFTIMLCTITMHV
jgi:hypothetical protein